MKGHDGQVSFFLVQGPCTYCVCNFCLLCSDTVWIASGSSRAFPGEFSREDLDPGGGLGAARFFMLLGGVVDLEDPGSWGSGLWMTLMLAKYATGVGNVFSKLIRDRSILAINSPLSRGPIDMTLMRSLIASASFLNSSRLKSFLDST